MSTMLNKDSSDYRFVGFPRDTRVTIWFVIFLKIKVQRSSHFRLQKALIKNPESMSR